MAVNMKRQCPACNGRMIIPDRGGRMQKCPLCDGAGSVEPQPIRVPFDYVIDEVLAAGGDRIQRALQFDRDASFEWIWLVATQTGIFTSRFTDGATGRQLDNEAVNNANRFGTAQLPFPLVEPYIWAPGASLNYLLVDTSAAPNTIQIVLRGYKLFPSQGA